MNTREANADAPRPAPGPEPGAVMGPEPGAVMGPEPGAVMGPEPGAVMGPEPGAVMGPEMGAEAQPEVRQEGRVEVGVAWRGVARRSSGVTGVKSLAVAAGAVLGLVRFLAGRDWPVGGIVAACAGAVVLVVAGAVAYDGVRVRAIRWRLTPERLELRSGITTRQHRSIPRDRVRSVDLRADPVHRMFGLAVVKVGTGEHAGDAPQLTLDPLTRHDAEALRRTLLRRGDPAGEGPLAELRWSWIRYAPLSVWTFTGAAVVLGALYKVFDSLGMKRFTTRLASELWAWIAAQPLLAVPLLLAVNVAVGVAGAMLLFAESWGRYRLDREPGRLRLRRGLLTTRSLTMEERRLRGVELSEPLLLRLAGAARVRTVATGLSKSGSKDTEDAAALTPPLPRPDALRIATAVTPAGSSLGEAMVTLTRHPPAARRRRVMRALATTGVAAGLPVAVAAGAVPWAEGAGWTVVAVVGTLVVPAYGLWMAAAGAANLGHALSPRHLITRRGALVRRTVALDRRGVAGWTFTETFFQRRSGLVTVSATTAAGRGHYEVVDVGRSDGLDLAAATVPGLLDPFLAHSRR
ncbi:PH domain-containing protein [Nonomuraea sp. NPDC049421]|uniref:PH domain-containing protein n=1 Tax=Nonomuraea sp. NPDC049421 TaxID=3155275 RepID=UPI00342F70C1